MKKRLLIGVGISMASLAMAFQLANYKKVSRTDVASKPEFPFQVRDEAKVDSVSGPLWNATIILTKDNFSKENLERLFRWYSETHADRRDRITVNVYTDPAKIQRRLMYTPTQTDLKSEADKGPDLIADAIFFRLRASAASEGAGESEFFHYDPSASGSVNQKSLVIKGTEPFAKKTLVDSWQTTILGVDTRIAGYELENVEPEGTYHSLECRDPDSGYWESIMSSVAVKGTDIAPITKNRIRIAGLDVIYVFLGSMFAMTDNKGVSWRVWDAERDIPCQERWTAAMIRDVQIEQKGVGIMEVQLAGQSDTIELHTSDFGAHWACN